jgi:hypothetical protein
MNSWLWRESTTSCRCNPRSERWTQLLWCGKTSRTLIFSWILRYATRWQEKALHLWKKGGVYALPGEKQGVHAKDFHRVASFALGGQPSNATSPLYGMYQLLSIKLAVRSEIPVRHREAQNMFQWMFFSGCWWIKCMLLCQFGCVWKLGVHMNTVYSPNNNVNGENDAWSSKFSLTRMNLKVIKFGGFCVGFDMICWM